MVIAALTTSYKFWGHHPSDYHGLNTYIYLCGFILIALQLYRRTRIVSWWAVPLMGLGTFVLFDSGPRINAGEFAYQIPMAIIMSAFAFWLMKDRKLQSEH